jgi:L-seryl-tRNA(Ser) seleniumtransferase
MLTLSTDEIDRRARALAAALAKLPGVAAAVINGASTVGGGSAPGSELPTRLVAIGVSGASAAELETRLRASEPPIIGRIEQDRVLIDLRTVDESDDSQIVDALTSATSA